MLPIVQRIGTDDADVEYRLGCALEQLGDRERALEYVSSAVRRGYPTAILYGTPELRDLVRDVRFQKLVPQDDERIPAESSGS